MHSDSNIRKYCVGVTLLYLAIKKTIKNDTHAYFLKLSLVT